MMNVRDILVATDFSEGAEQALRVALLAGTRTRARLHVVYVQVTHPDPFAPSAYPAGHRDRVMKAMQRRYSAILNESEFPAAHIPEVTFEVLDDAAVVPALLSYVREADIDLVVAGTHGRRGLRHMMLGSVAEELVRSLSCPVLTVRGDADVEPLAAGVQREILVPVDFSQNSVAGLRAAREMASLFGVRLRVLHVVEETLHPAFYNAGTFSIYDIQPDIEERAWDHLRQMLSDTPGPLVPVELEIVDGRAAVEIARVASDTHAWMIVMATHGLSGLAHLFMGSVTEHVVRTAPCPVFVVRNYGKSLFEPVGDPNYAERHE